MPKFCNKHEKVSILASKVFSVVQFYSKMTMEFPSDRQPNEQIMTSKEIDNVHVISNINCTNYY